MVVHSPIDDSPLHDSPIRVMGRRTKVKRIQGINDPVLVAEEYTRGIVGDIPAERAGGLALDRLMSAEESMMR